MAHFLSAVVLVVCLVLVAGSFFSFFASWAYQSTNAAAAQLDSRTEEIETLLPVVYRLKV